MSNADRCISCGEIIPEGWQVCPKCEERVSTATHDVKIRKEYYDSVAQGDKPFEVRYNDRNYKVGDKLVMREVDASGMPSGRVITARVSYVLSDDRYVQYGYVILGLRDVTAREGEGNDDM